MTDWLTDAKDRTRLLAAGTIAAACHAVLVALAPAPGLLPGLQNGTSLVFLEPPVEVEVDKAPGPGTAAGTLAGEAAVVSLVSPRAASRSQKADVRQAEEPVAPDSTASGTPASSLASTSGELSGAGARPSSSRSPSGRGAGGGSEGPGRGPLLSTAADPCGDLFPAEAEKSFGVVMVAVEVASTGRTSRTRILDERPHGQGFARAAHDCSDRLRFRPALDAAGRPIAASSVVRLKFARND